MAQSGPKTSTSVLDTSPIHPNSIDMVTFSPNAPQFSFGVLCSVGGACGGFVVDGNGQYWFEIETLQSDTGVSDGHCLENLASRKEMEGVGRTSFVHARARREGMGKEMGI